MIAMYLLLIWDTGPWYLKPTISGPVLLWMAAALTLVTGYAYLRTALRYLSEDTPH
jgi:cardiolipin synthase